MNQGIPQENHFFDWYNGRVSDFASIHCPFNPHGDHCYDSLTALGKLLTPNVNPLKSPRTEWVPG